MAQPKIKLPPFRISRQDSAGFGYKCVFPRYIYLMEATDILHDKEIYYIIEKTHPHECIQIQDYKNNDNNNKKSSRIGTVVMHDEGNFYEIDDSDRNSDINTHIGSFTTPKIKEPNVVIDKATIFATYYVYSKTKPQTVQGGKKSRKQRKQRKLRKSKKQRKSRK